MYEEKKYLGSFPPFDESLPIKLFSWDLSKLNITKLKQRRAIRKDNTFKILKYEILLFNVC